MILHVYAIPSSSTTLEHKEEFQFIGQNNELHPIETYTSVVRESLAIEV